MSLAVNWCIYVFWHADKEYSQEIRCSTSILNSKCIFIVYTTTLLVKRVHYIIIIGIMTLSKIKRMVLEKKYVERILKKPIYNINNDI